MSMSATVAITLSTLKYRVAELSLGRANRLFPAPSGRNRTARGFCLYRVPAAGVRQEQQGSDMERGPNAADGH
jgi:hypothetical protein